jgi:hypothetical protein
VWIKLASHLFTLYKSEDYHPGSFGVFPARVICFMIIEDMNPEKPASRLKCHLFSVHKASQMFRGDRDLISSARSLTEARMDALFVSGRKGSELTLNVLL